MRSIFIMSFTDLSRDSRVRRQIKAVLNEHCVITCGTRPSGLSVSEHIPYIQRKKSFFQRVFSFFNLLTRRYEQYLKAKGDVRQVLSKISVQQIDVIVANDVETLPAAHALKMQKQSKLVFDAHEYSPRQFENMFLWNLLFRPLNAYLLNTYLPHVDKMLTVSKGIADEYNQRFGVQPEVVINTADHYELKSTPVKPNKIRLVHHGVALPGRSLELLIRAMGHMDRDRYSLHLVLMPTIHKRYHNRLRRLVDRSKNVQLLPPVPYNEIVTFCNGYDVGIAFYPPRTFNLRYSLPNKLFEYVQARLAVVCGPSPSIMEYIDRYELGIIATDFSLGGLTRALMKLTPENIRSFKNNADKSSEILSSKPVMRRIQEILETV